MKIDHSIKHCNGFSCTIRNECHRYLLHKHAREQDMVWMPYLHPIICIDENHGDLIPTKPIKGLDDAEEHF